MSKSFVELARTPSKQSVGGRHIGTKLPKRNAVDGTYTVTAQVHRERGR